MSEGFVGEDKWAGAICVRVLYLIAWALPVKKAPGLGISAIIRVDFSYKKW